MGDVEGVARLEGRAVVVPIEVPRIEGEIRADELPDYLKSTRRYIQEQFDRGVERIASLTGWSRTTADRFLREFIAKTQEIAFNETISRWFYRGDEWKPPELLPESERKPIGADYFHQLPSNKHPWERDGIEKEV